MRIAGLAAILLAPCAVAAAVGATSFPGTARAQPAPAAIVADARGSDDQGGWDYAAVDAAIGRLLIARTEGVGTLGLRDNRLGPMLATGRHLHQVLPLPGTRILFTNGDTDTASVIDARSGTLLASLPTGAKPDAAILDPSDQTMLVMNGRSGSITRIAVGDGTPHVIGTIAVGGALETPALDGHGRLYVNIEDRNQIAVIDLATGQVTARYALAGCDRPTGLAHDGAHHLLISSCANGVAKILHEDGSEAASLAIGKGPDAVIADPAHDRVFIPSGGDGTLAQIALDGTPRVARVIATRPGARTGALDPATQRIYLPYGRTIRTAGQPTKLAPGSFGVLVVDVR